MYKKNLVFLAACLGMLLFGISLITLGSVAGFLKQKFQLDGIAAGTIFSLLPVGILTGSLVFGPVCDRYGYKWLLVLACIGMFAGFEGIAYAGSLSWLKLSVLVFGVGSGIVNGATNAVVADISTRNKGADLSLLGVFFGIGALGMPLLLGLLAGRFAADQVVAGVGIFTALIAGVYIFVRFPGAKPKEPGQSAAWKQLLDGTLMLIAFFLFFQSSIEAIINNWATTYLVEKGGMDETAALFALTLHVAGMVLMRLLNGSILSNVSPKTSIYTCLLLLATGVLLMQYGHYKPLMIAGLVLSGAGVAAGFPVMLGMVGERFPKQSGTAFSFVFAFALVGNMLLNYLMGVVVHDHGIAHLTTVSYLVIACMMIISLILFRNNQSTINK
ncbi:MFS transporter [Pseudobacter ginsenosidimutans]|uniref:Fucose permease n=1 Tax=Pseudobacter ginsenosidimutans TaxID=661488 RepID=A0A4Q7N207_9BACT|nr:MFS transporter [Pseudobacter ginsenosidimutans]RZS75473.1 fucose permease [Pseudobacter ginsenosidimutans]